MDKDTLTKYEPPITVPFIIFLDIDGVLNCRLFYENDGEGEICAERMAWLNQLCIESAAKVVISSTWRMGKSIPELQETLNSYGATFEIIGKTPSMQVERGCEISRWLKDHTGRYFKNYAIIDDDSDMLLSQYPNFFQVDNYSGLTPNTCYKVGRFAKGL